MNNKLKLFSLILATVFLCQCSQTKDISNNLSTSSNIEYLLIKDSVYIDKYHIIQNIGDTIYIRDSIVKYKISIVRDTIKITDTLITVQERVVEKTNAQQNNNLYKLNFIILIASIIIIYGIKKIFSKKV